MNKTLKRYKLAEVGYDQISVFLCQNKEKSVLQIKT
jgi:hypothetical protein